MAKILRFQPPQREDSLISLFDRACDNLLQGNSLRDPAREAARIMQIAVIRTGINPHQFSLEQQACFEMLLSG